MWAGCDFLGGSTFGSTSNNIAPLVLWGKEQDWHVSLGGNYANRCVASCSIQTWALEEARRRLEAEGILPDPSTSSLPGAKK